MERRLAAILSIDVVGYARLMGRDEARTLAALKAHRAELIDPQTALYGGKTVKLMGDGALMEFASAVDAVRFAVAVQCAMRRRNEGEPEDQRLAFRIGINIGDVIAEDGDIHGDGVNVASRLEGLAEPGGICIRRNVRNQVRDKLALDFQDLGDVEVKNIERPVRAFHVVLNERAEALAVAPAKGTAKRPTRFGKAVVGIALSIALITGLAWWRPWAPDLAPARAERMAFPLPDKPSIAVIPFENLSHKEDTDFLSDGLTEDIIANISRIPDFFVVSRDTVARYRDDRVEPRRAAEELGVRYILTGSLRAQESQVRVTAQLIDATAGNYVWAERFDGELTDVLSLQDEIALDVASALFDKVSGLRGREARASRLTTESLEAWELNVRAITLWRKINRDSLAQARALWQRAVEIDPSFAQAWAKLGESHMVEARFGWSKDVRRSGALAQEHAEKALAIDPENVSAHTVLAFRKLYGRDHDAAIAAARRALTIDPNNTEAMYALADILRYSGEFEEAIQHMREAIRRNPDHPDWYLYGLGVALYHANSNEESIATLLRLLERNPKYSFGHYFLAANYLALGDEDAARREAELELKVNPQISLDWVRSVVPYRNPADLEQIVSGLNEVGIPE